MTKIFLLNWIKFPYLLRAVYIKLKLKKLSKLVIKQFKPRCVWCTVPAGKQYSGSDC